MAYILDSPIPAPLQAKLGKCETPIDYVGLSTNTADVYVNNERHSIAVNVNKIKRLRFFIL